MTTIYANSHAQIPFLYGGMTSFDGLIETENFNMKQLNTVVVHEIRELSPNKSTNKGTDEYVYIRKVNGIVMEMTTLRGDKSVYEKFFASI